MKLKVYLVCLLMFGFAMANQAYGQSEAKTDKSMAKKTLAVGDKAVDFEIQSIGKKIKLSDNFGEKGKPTVLVFSRANW